MSEPTIIVALISGVCLIIASFVGAGKYFKLKAENGYFNEFKEATKAIQDSYQATVKDLRVDKEHLKNERDDFRNSLERISGIVQTNTIEIALLKGQRCTKVQCSNRENSI